MKMKINKESLYRIGIIALIAAYCLHTSSCANTKGAPSGGPRDSIPPVVTRMLPDSNAKDFPLYKGIQIMRMSQIDPEAVLCGVVIKKLTVVTQVEEERHTVRITNREFK